MYTPLHAAASSGQVSVVKLLLEMGAEVDAVNCFGNTALHVACHNGQDVVVTELLGYGAAIDAVNNMGLVNITLLAIFKVSFCDYSMYGVQCEQFALYDNYYAIDPV